MKIFHIRKLVFLTFLLWSSLFAMPAEAEHWVSTWGTAPQLVESNNNPPSPGLQNNSLRQIMQVSIGGETVRLRLSNEFSTGKTEIKAVEIARATTAGSSCDIDESSSVSLTFNGEAGVTMAAGETATSDAVSFHIGNRENIAITIHYGQASSTSVTGHPGSRTTSYLKAGNTTDFSNAVKTEHWYSIVALDVMAPDNVGAVAILGNSITDGRGSTTNQQNRWPDVLSRKLLDSGMNVGVLNMGIGGNCVLNGGLGPTAKERYKRDLFGHEGVQWIIIFEAVNDLGNSWWNTTQVANDIIEVYKQIIKEAHDKGIYVYGATITPFKNSSYYNADREKGRSTINQWIRTTDMFDGIVDFDEAVRNPSDKEALKSEYLFENDWLHLNPAGYEAMGNCVSLNLFATEGPREPGDSSDPNDNPGDEVNTLSSNLPLIFIETEEAINADHKVPGTMKVIDNPDGQRNSANDTEFAYNGRIGIKWRGNSSLSFDQKKYTIETQDETGEDLKVALLGMPEESDWVLDAPYNDISLVRDVYAFNLWNEMGHWGPRTRMCEVTVNGSYRGVYNFCEKIKRDKNRVDISKLKPEDVEGRNLTGGYIVRVDAFDDGDETFESKVPGIQASMWGGNGTGTVTWTNYYPEKGKIMPEQKAYIQDFVDKMEASFQAANFADPEEGYAKWIDVPSFVDYFIHTELSLNADGFKRSSYFFKDKDKKDGTLSKMEAGPVWDFNLAYGNCNFCNANNPEAWVHEGCYTNPTPAFWKKLTKDPNFMAAVKERYAQLRQNIISKNRIDDFFDSYAELLDEAKDRHYEVYSNLFSSGNNDWWWGWGGSSNPVAAYAGYFVESYEEEITVVKEWFAKRLTFLDKQWGYDPESSHINNIKGYFNLSMQISADCLRINTDRPLGRIEVYSLSGSLLQSETPSPDDMLISMPLTAKQPVIVACYAQDGSFISYKVK